MFIAFSKTRHANLYVIVAVATVLILILSFAIVPSLAAPKPALIPETGGSQYADYYQRHPELVAPAEITVDISDYFMRHPDLSIPTENIDLSDYFLRH